MSKAWILFSESTSRVHVFAAIEDRDDKRLIELELAGEADGVAPPDPVLSDRSTL